ncbi:ROK family protein [Agromyces subbeticus]|uniref:ROK family protein n=1 Tax=Agromyces subbeticus TaxID=293890 RepID=UPI0003B3116B|nr:ROK family protein [Agromyces subbeticus]
MNLADESDASDGAVRIGIDLGGTGTRFVALDGEAVAASASFATPSEADATAVVAFLVEQVRAVASDRPIAYIGIGASGPVDAAGMIRNPDTLPAFTGVELRRPLIEAFGVPVTIDNDAVAAAVFEVRAGAARGFASTLVVTLGTGVGVAALRGVQPMRGADGQHPEAGHLSVNGADAPCYCGRSACFEQLVSRAALQRSAAALIAQSPAIPADGAAVIDQAAELARAGHPGALALFERFGTLLAAGVADLVTVFRPDCVVIGGSAARFSSEYSEAFQRRLSQLEVYRAHPGVRFSAAGDFGGAIGAALQEPRAQA